MTIERTLTLDERARRRANRKSNQVRREYPLLAQAGVVNDWLTTPEQARAQLERIDRDAEVQLRRLADSQEKSRQKGIRLREQVAGQVDAETLALLDNHVDTVYPSSYATGFWQRVLDGKFDIHAWLADIERIRLLGQGRKEESCSD